MRLDRLTLAEAAVFGTSGNLLGPVPDDSPSVSAPASASDRIEVPHRLKILMLEDEPTDAELMQRALREAGLDFSSQRVDTRASFTEALEQFAPDVVLADYKLPDFTGADALAHVRQFHPEIPVVMVTGALGDEGAIDLVHSGARDYVLKSNLVRLPTAVRRAIAIEQDIRARKVAETALRESEVRYRELFQSTRDAMMLLDTSSSRFIAANPSTVKLFGAEDETAFLAHTPWEHSPERQPDGCNSADKAREMIEIAMRTGSHFFEWTHRRVDGTEFNADVLLTRVVHGDETLLYAAIRDITDRKSAEAATRASNALLETVERIAHVGGFDWDIASGAVVWSEETYRIFGLGPGEFVPTVPHFVERIHPDDRARVRQAIDASVTQNQPFEAEFRIVRPDGVERIVAARGEMHHDKAGNPIRITGTGEDVTERKRAEATIREDEAKFRSLVEQNVAGIFIIREDGTVGYVNPFFANLLGYAASELIGHPLFDLIPEAVKPAVRAGVAAQIAGDAEFVLYPSSMLARDGRPIEVLVNASRSIFEGRPASLAVVLDVTESNRSQRELASTAAILKTEHDVSPDGILVVDPHRSLIYVNRPFVEMWNFPAELIAAKSEERLFAWALPKFADPTAIAIQVNHLYAHPDEYGQFDTPLKDGRVFDIRSSPMNRPDGGYLGRVWFFRDITDRTRAEETLRASEERFRQLIENAPDAILIYDADEDHFIDANRAAEQLFGCGRNEIVKYGPQHFYDPEQSDTQPVEESFTEHKERALAGDEINYERRIVNGQGQERLCDVTLVRLPSPGHRLLRASFSDITERKAAERALAFERAILATEHELSPDGILVVDSAAMIVSFNRRFAEIMNVPAELLVARRDEPVLAWVTDHMADPQGFLSRVRYLNAHRDETSREEIILKDARVLDRYSMPLQRANGDYLGRVWFFRDITDQKAAERVLRRLNRTLRTLSRGNEVLVRAVSEPELLNEMCRVIVAVGGYRMAWVGLAEHDAAKSVTPVAWAGEIGQYLEKARITWADEPRGRGPHGRAIRSGEPQVTQNIGIDPRMTPWQQAAKESGFGSSVVLPLNDASGVFAALMIYSPEIDAFDTDELNLLRELANDLAFGIRSLREHTAREALDKRWRAGLEATVGAIASTVEMRDPYTAGHQQRVARLAVAIARELALPEQQIEGLYLAGIVHDVGKIDIPAEILNKPGKISKLQYQMLQGHAEAGYDILKGVDFPWPIAQMVRQHHERLDGSGYPQGLKGEAILTEAKILAVADVVEAMMSHRPYRPALGIEAALTEIVKGQGSLFDPAAVAACVALFRQHGFAFE